MKQEAFILFDYTDLKAVNFSLLEECDRIAVCPGAMLTFKRHGLTYLTFDDFYNYRQFRIDNTDLIEATEILFSVLDKKYEPFLGYPRAFRGNIYWFLVFFADMYYFSRVGREISKKYKKVYLTTEFQHEDLSEVNLTSFLANLEFAEFRKGLGRKIQIFGSCLNSQCVWLNTNGFQSKNVGINKYLLLSMAQKAPKKMLAVFESFFSRIQPSTKKVIFIIPDAFEARLLKEYMPEFLYIDPTKELLQKVKNNTDILNLAPQFLEELEEFSKKHFPNCGEYIQKLFSTYHKEILCRLNSLYERIEERFNCYKPSALFYSVGAMNVYEDMCAFIANQGGIPIFYFQHGGAATSAFSHHPYQRYAEHNKNIVKTNIFQSKVEKQYSFEGVSSDSPVLGSIKLYQIYAGKKKNIPLQRIKRILYCPGLFTFLNYKDLMFNVEDRELFEVTQDIFDVVCEGNVKMDVKLLESSTAAYHYRYFSRLAEAYKNKNIRILRGFPAEMIIKNYGLFLMDYLVTALLPVYMILDVPIVVYLRDTSFLRSEAIDDIEKRLYVVRNKSDLEKYIKLYLRGELVSKFSPEIVDKYAFPINDGDPGVCIADYIRTNV